LQEKGRGCFQREGLRERGRGPGKEETYPCGLVVESLRICIIKK
jgi:hypothetical protein